MSEKREGVGTKRSSKHERYKTEDLQGLTSCLGEMKGKAGVKGNTTFEIGQNSNT